MNPSSFIERFRDRSSITRGRIIAPSAAAGNPLGLAPWFHRRWHLTPWKSNSLLGKFLGDGEDGGLMDDDEDGGETTGLDVLNNVVTQAGAIFGRGNTGIVSRNRAMPLGPMPAKPGTPGAPVFMGLTQNQLLLGGAAIAGVLLFLKMKKR